MTAKEFENLIVQAAGQAGVTLSIHYDNDTVVNGFPSKVDWNYSPTRVVFTASVTTRGHSSDHIVQFDRILKLVVHTYGKGSVEHS